MNKLMQKKDRLLRQLKECKNMVRGSLNSVCINCKRANCVCKNPTGGLAHRLTYKDRNQKTRIVYVANDKVAAIKKMVKDYAKYREVTEQIVETNIALLRSGVKF
jgi:histidinol phosphatase-like enzyme